jgi:hydrogenase maturation factor HypE
VLKEIPGGLAYATYSANNASRPEAFVHTTSDVGLAGTSAVPLSAWTHLAWTYDGTTLRMFVNGVQVSSRAVSGAVAATAGALRIGGNSIWGEYFRGQIDEVRIYNRPLTAAEIQTDMSTPIP